MTCQLLCAAQTISWNCKLGAGLWRCVSCYTECLTKLTADVFSWLTSLGPIDSCLNCAQHCAMASDGFKVWNGNSLQFKAGSPTGLFCSAAAQHFPPSSTLTGF